jgi:hypothetical protein
MAQKLLYPFLSYMSETTGCGLGPKSGKGCKGSSDVNTEVQLAKGIRIFG